MKRYLGGSAFPRSRLLSRSIAGGELDQISVFFVDRVGEWRNRRGIDGLFPGIPVPSNGAASLVLGSMAIMADVAVGHRSCPAKRKR